MRFRLQQKSMTLNDLERQFTALSSEYACFDQTARLESRGFRYKVALYVAATGLRGTGRAPASLVIELGSDREQWAIC